MSQEIMNVGLNQMMKFNRNLGSGGNLTAIDHLIDNVVIDNIEKLLKARVSSLIPTKIACVWTITGWLQVSMSL